MSKYKQVQKGITQIKGGQCILEFIKNDTLHAALAGEDLKPLIGAAGKTVLC